MRERCLRWQVLAIAAFLAAGCTGGSGSSGGGGGGGGGGGTCVTPTPTAFCAAQGATCDTVSGKDVCGNDRTEACGTCGSGLTCSSAHVCTSTTPPTSMVLAYHPDYQWTAVPASAVPWEHITHLILTFMQPTGGPGAYGVKATGSGPAGSSLASWEAAAKVYADAAHQHGVRLLVSFGGDDSSGRYWTVFESATTDALATQLAKVMVAEVQKTGADGIDVDWEGGSDDGSGKMRIVKALRTEWSTAFLSLTLGAAYNGASSLTKFAAVEDQVDAFMTMDYITPPPSWSWWLGALPRIPLHGVKSPWGNDPITYSYDYDLQTWTGAGIPAAKVVFGVGGYGEVWADTNGDGKAPAEVYTNRAALANDPTCAGSGPCIQAADTETDPIGCSDNHVTQQWVDQVVAASGGKLTLEQDLDGGATYWGAPGPSQLVSAAGPCGGTIQIGSIMYESPLSMSWKAAYVKEKGAGGLMFWTLSQTRNAGGTYPLLEAVKP